MSEKLIRTRHTPGTPVAAPLSGCGFWGHTCGNRAIEVLAFQLGSVGDDDHCVSGLQHRRTPQREPADSLRHWGCRRPGCRVCGQTTRCRFAAARGLDEDAARCVGAECHDSAPRPYSQTAPIAEAMLLTAVETWVPNAVTATTATTAIGMQPSVGPSLTDAIAGHRFFFELGYRVNSKRP